MIQLGCVGVAASAITPLRPASCYNKLACLERIDSTCSSRQRGNATQLRCEFKLPIARAAVRRGIAKLRASVDDDRNVESSSSGNSDTSSGSSGGKSPQPGGGKNVDWDSAWTSFQRNIQNQVDSRGPKERGAFSAPPPKQRSAGGTARTPLQERIRQQETQALDFWSSEAFFKVGVAGALVLLVVFVILVGPPPDDGRCTLPWC